MKKYILIYFLIFGALAFVIKEVFFFDPTNPYSAKEIGPDDLKRFKQQMGDQYPELMSPEEFAESQINGNQGPKKPLPGADALELATAQFEAYCDSQALDKLDFKVPVEVMDTNFLWVFDFHAKNSSINDVKVTIDKYLRIAVSQLPKGNPRANP